MGKLSVCLVVALIACGSSSKGKPDAQIVVHDSPPDMKIFNDAPPDAPPTFDLSCLGNMTYLPANANVTVSGMASEVDVQGFNPSIKPLVGATVDACQGACASPLATSTTDSTGAYSDGPIATGGTHISVYLKITPPTPAMGSADEPVREYPGEDLTADFMGAPIFALTPGALSALSAVAGCTVQSGKTILGVAVTDCSNMPITDTANVTLSIMQNGSAVTGTTSIDLGKIPGVPAIAKGTFLVCNVPASTMTTVGAIYKGMAFLAHDVVTAAGEITAAQVRPGI